MVPIDFFTGLTIAMKIGTETPVKERHEQLFNSIQDPSNWEHPLGGGHSTSN